MNDIPLTDASFSEVLARVAYVLIERRRLRLVYGNRPPSEWSPALTHQLDRAGFTALAFWTSAYAFAEAQGELPVFTRTAFLTRARLGMDLRSVAFAAYKAPRRAPPRVTNRGGGDARTTKDKVR